MTYTRFPSSLLNYSFVDISLYKLPVSLKSLFTFLFHNDNAEEEEAEGDSLCQEITRFAALDFVLARPVDVCQLPPPHS